MDAHLALGRLQYRNNFLDFSNRLGFFVVVLLGILFCLFWRGAKLYVLFALSTGSRVVSRNTKSLLKILGEKSRQSNTKYEQMPNTLYEICDS